MASVEREPIVRVWGLSPAGSRGNAPGEPLVKGQKGEAPPEAESFLKTVTKAMLEFFNVKVE